MERATKELVDEMMYSYKNKLEEYMTYMEEMYLKGTLLMLDITDEIESENLEYASRLGLSNGEELYYKFLEKYQIEEKRDILYALLLFYKQNGTFECEEIKEATRKVSGFWECEYVRLVKAVEELFQMQVLLYEKSGSTLLSESDCNLLYAKAKELGFFNIDYVKAIIKGNMLRFQNQ